MQLPETNLLEGRDSKMPSKYRLRRVFKPLVQGLARALVKLGCTPNGATIIVLASSIASVVFFLVVPLNWLAMMAYALVVFFTGVMDGVDGAIARTTGRKTRWGAVLDSTMDRYSDAVVFFTPGARELFRGDVISSSWLGLPVVGLIPLWAWAVVLVIGSYITSYVRARATLADPSLDVDVGMFGRSERLFIIVIASVCNVLPLAIVALAILTNMTAIYRVMEARRGLPAGKT
ncbi:MAG: CDP-alcohol phosphatidyltransferase family protein [Candidatus Sigynarchaeota archaeon]